MSLLYILGVLGGVVATLLGVFSYKVMFIFGGFIGFSIYAFRFKNAGSMVFLFRNYSKSLMLNFLITLPYFFVITVMFALVKFIATDVDFASLVKLFLFGFFVENIISGIYNQYFKSPNLFFIINIIIFLISIFAYRYISSNFIFLYGIFIGLIGGGYNIMWAQYAATEFPTEVRSLACNMIFALGRTSSIFFGGLLVKNSLDKGLISLLLL